MKTPHLIPALSALILALGFALGFNIYAQQIESRYIHAIAPLGWFQKTAGGALQSAALHQSDLLPIYGSSELRAGSFQVGRDLLSTYPTGFMIFPIGWAETGSLSMALTLAASDGAARNQKIVISLSPAYFSTSTPFYVENFSDLDAKELAFSTRLSLPLKQRFGRRMLQYPKTLVQDPILRFALEQLADGSMLHQALYYAILPLGRFQLWVSRLQDHWTVLTLIQKQKLSSVVHKKPRVMNWPRVIAEFTKQAAQRADNNPFGFDNNFWKAHQAEILSRKNDWPNHKLAQAILGSPEWGDLDLLLREVKELGAHGIILNVPLKGVFDDYRGNSPTTRALYYEKLRKLGARYTIPVISFEEHDADKYFVSDLFDHLSSEGWVYYDQSMDAFYHNTLHKTVGH